MNRDSLRVAVVVPLRGPSAIYGPSCVLCARLAAEELNAGRGVLGRQVELRIVDGGGPPRQVAAEIDRLVVAGEVDAVVGWHLSVVRQHLTRATEGRVPYVYTALYEGGETTPGVFAIGETPAIQLLPALDWMTGEIDVRRWFVVGDDYVWPRRSTALVRRFLDDRRGLGVDGERFVALGTSDYGEVLREIESSGCDGVLLFLVGDDAVHFHRQFAARGLEDQCARFSTLMDESMLRAIGSPATRDVFASAGYFEALPTAESLRFGARYVGRFGPEAPAPGAPGESCYEGVRMLAALVEETGTCDVGALCATAEAFTYHGPRGTVAVERSRARQRIYLATTDGTDYDVLAAL
ncbi:putative nitrile hydratase regulator clustered with urea transport [Pseudonocardia sp. Ae168_Ps1]|uniref:substrate-binding domain-containing protein n=1 Tax=unclassified Pseudonocardia TaxID=2619320 RepID=UPI00094B2B34|nr:MULTISPECIES: substrate-binding domain-containing protein [unclassified Pseudonocardia]OLL74832.1 putative nitrile hydratase regulator clustered with urea transport [Pseudonocardia sp. Ae150A_Ps1]OLL80824.1 putative nitrile hydratase regulator clustered with urea transport [Pseudonocardia sp. Ae168_Ps1]OLL85058.1 putative nitrile hydratase regulator clustered with urea transport [Pseudonocardia sp. Ae263_Ps1]OLL94925.1 putative nitrile hydratase regulator clustered with urea transport [Pseud